MFSFLKRRLSIDWIFNATVLGKKYNNAIQCEQGAVTNDTVRNKRMRETTDTSGLNEEKPSLMDLHVQHVDISREDIVGEIASITGAGTDTISVACGYVLALLGDNQHIQERVMQE